MRSLSREVTPGLLLLSALAVATTGSGCDAPEAECGPVNLSNCRHEGLAGADAGASADAGGDAAAETSADAATGSEDEGPSCPLWSHMEPPSDFQQVCNPNGLDIRAKELEMVELINADRRQHSEEANGAEPVSYQCAVAEVARRHSYDLCKERDLAHELFGEGPGDRIAEDLGWTLGQDYAIFGENIAWNQTLEAAETAFVEEEPPCDPEAGGHRLNVLNDSFRFVGVGFCDCAVEDAPSDLVVTQDFVTFDQDEVKPGNPYCEARNEDFDRRSR